SITGIIGVIGCMRYELSIVLPERDEEAVNLLGASLLFASAIGALTIPIVVVGRRPLLARLQAPVLARVIWLSPPIVFRRVVFLSLNYWISRSRRFGRLSVARVSSSATTSAVQVGAGLAGRASGPTLVSATVIGTAVSTAVLAGQILRDDRHLFRRSLAWSSI